MNLHPDFVIPAEKIHEDRYFQSIETMSRLQDSNVFEEILKSAGAVTSDLADYYAGLRQAKSFHDNADLLKLAAKTLSLCAAGKQRIAEESLSKEAQSYGLPESVTVASIVDVACAVGGVRAKNIKAALENLARQAEEKNAEQASAAWKYLEEEHFGELSRSFAEIFLTFEKFHREFLPIMMHLRVFGTLEQTASVSSLNFSDTKMMYGNIYEVLTSAFVVPALVNNVAAGRNYNTFERLTLKQYLEIDKSGRHNCFAAQSDLSALHEGLDNQLRNASHHQAISFNVRASKIAFRSGKSSTRRYMSYAEYLAKTLMLFENLVGVLHFVIGIRRARNFTDAW